MSLLVLIALFIIGLVQDILAALYLRCVSEEKYKLAALLSIIITLLAYGVWIALVEQFLSSGGFGYLLVYSIGGGIGTYLAFIKKGGKSARS